MEKQMKELSKIIEGMDLSQMLELKKMLETKIAVKALKAINPEVLEEIDGQKALTSSVSLAAKANLL